jgi:hypothetical protein
LSVRHEHDLVNIGCIATALELRPNPDASHVTQYELNVFSGRRTGVRAVTIMSPILVEGIIRTTMVSRIGQADSEDLPGVGESGKKLPPGSAGPGHILAAPVAPGMLRILEELTGTSGG